MGFVMVPIPDDLTGEVESYLLALVMRARAAQTAMTVETASAVQLVRSLNPDCRVALSALADASATGDGLTIGQLATTLQWPDSKAAGVAHELVELVWSALGPVMSILTTAATVANAGSIDWDDRQLFLGREFALAVVAAEKQIAEQQT